MRDAEFYVGYLAMPGGLKKVMRRAIACLGVGGAVVAGLLVAGQHPFAASTFEFGQDHEFRGVLLTQPYPSLLIAGQGTPWLLVAPGKHGLSDVGALDGKPVKLRGERIYRGPDPAAGDHMIEVLPGSLAAEGAGPGQIDGAGEIDYGHMQLAGEIADSKCYFGVMNPGEGKVHRDCAVRCISGGIPPALLTRDADGRLMAVVLANWKRALLDHVAEPVTLQGRLVRSHGRLILRLE